MEVNQLRRAVLWWSAVPVALGAVAVGIWLGTPAVLAVIGAWLISSFNLVLLMRDGQRIFAQPPNEVRTRVQKSFRIRFLWVGLLLMILYLLLSSQLSSLTVGIVFLAVYLCMTVVFAGVVAWQSKNSKFADEGRRDCCQRNY